MGSNIILTLEDWKFNLDGTDITIICTHLVEFLLCLLRFYRRIVRLCFILLGRSRFALPTSAGLAAGFAASGFAICWCSWGCCWSLTEQLF